MMSVNSMNLAYPMKKGELDRKWGQLGGYCWSKSCQWKWWLLFFSFKNKTHTKGNSVCIRSTWLQYFGDLSETDERRILKIKELCYTKGQNGQLIG